MVDGVLEEISFYTQIDKNKILNFASSNVDSHSNYKKISIPKRNGDRRIIYSPIAEIKYIQHFLIYKYFSKIKISEFAKAYAKNTNTVDNALSHAKNNHFLFIDLKDFFNSIDYDVLKNILNKELDYQYKNSDLSLMLNLCSMKKKFVQGNVSSPILSNIYLKEFDLFASDLVKKISNGVYTRYSDDITISSSEKIDESILNKIQDELVKYKLTLNKQKTHYSSNLQNVKITGLRINNKKIGIDTAFKKNLKNRIYHYLNTQNSQENPDVLLGLLSYLKMVDYKYYRTINFKYKKDNILTVDLIKKKRNESINDNT